ncbi:alpha/beta fold hydrolase [Microlunatus parietis]|uniref:Pimeloyl-ACP methyl ester carboxylesterase n=1 Tax=Microlunatus parietis TaxID=682979 RepID=A0A7Y9I4Z4_9ACTN|nr:alpha/beta hydrolase [Microlunatus parietis]NYE70370.1 pimeloyl-ACP methyl ester carboxylesterase [Microlunatus parietis]
MAKKRWIVLGIGGALVLGLVAVAATYVDQNTNYTERDAEQLARAGVTTKITTIGGHQTHYAEGPDNGPPLLLIHGQGSQWDDYAKVLPTLINSHHVFAIDVYGHGRSARLPAQDYTAVRIGTLIAEFMEQELGGPAMVSGHSSGALLAAWLAANRPDLVSGVLLEDPPFYSSIMPRAAKTTGGAIFSITRDFLAQTEERDFQRYFIEHGDYFAFFGPAKTQIETYALGYLDDHPGEPLEIFFLPPMVNVFFRGLVNYDPAFGAAWFDNHWYEGYDTDTVLKSIKVPTVLLHTNYFQQSTGSYYQNGVLMAAMDGDEKERTLGLLSNEELVEIASGHLVHFERPDAYLDAFARLTARVP